MREPIAAAEPMRNFRRLIPLFLIDIATSASENAADFLRCAGGCASVRAVTPHVFRVYRILVDVFVVHPDHDCVDRLDVRETLLEGRLHEFWLLAQPPGGQNLV